MYGPPMPTVWSQARETTRLAERGDARLHPADGPKVGHPEEDVVAHLSTYIFFEVGIRLTQVGPICSVWEWWKSIL